MDLSREQRGQNVDKIAVAGNHEQTLAHEKPIAMRDFWVKSQL